MFSSKKFQKLLPDVGSKYKTAIIVAPDLLTLDANYFINQIKNYAKENPDKTNVLGVGHNTMILAAASMIISYDNIR